MSTTSAPIVLLTGGSGLIGSALTQHLIHLGYSVRNLSRNPSKNSSAYYQEYHWQPSKNLIDTQALESVDYIINMAGAGINDRRWIQAYKKTILDSRVDSTRCIVSHIQKLKSTAKFMSFSATGIYGDRGATIITEDASTDLDRNDFLSQVCHQWEAEARKIPCSVLRVPPVVTREGGVLPSLLQASNKGIIGVVSDPQNYFSWVHLDDLISIVLHTMNYPAPTINACSPQAIQNGDMIEALKSVYKLKGIVVTIPKWILKLTVGGVAEELSKSIYADSDVLKGRKFTFRYPSFIEAISAEKELST